MDNDTHRHFDDGVPDETHPDELPVQDDTPPVDPVGTHSDL
ncbi:hypothetical protein ACFQDN_24140 [Pseudomonas asuensis]|jgi:hypothetical protein|nr:hypothetical protein [Pseudomonas asuensis]